MPAPRISVSELKDRLKKESITLIDVRQGDPYTESQIKIKDSIRIDPNDDGQIQSFIASALKTKPIVTFCT